MNRPAQTARTAVHCTSGAMPMPVSCTTKQSVTRFDVAASRRTRSLTPPRSVNLIALESRLVRIWLRRVASPSSAPGRSSGASISKAIPLASACTAITSVSSFSRLRRLNAARSTINSPASIFDRSSTLLSTTSSDLLASLIFARKASCCSFSDVCPSRYDRPITAFIGVRISWLMLARNSLLARFACSALCVASRSDSSYCLRSVMSRAAANTPCSLRSRS